MDMIFCFCVIGLFLCVISFLLGLNDEDNYLIGLIYSSIIFIILVILVSAKRNKPTALDVYQGKTTLEITYKDSVPIDSVVVFK